MARTKFFLQVIFRPDRSLSEQLAIANRGFRLNFCQPKNPRMSLQRLVSLGAILFYLIGSVGFSAQLQATQIRLVNASEVDKRTLTFAEGPAAKFSTTVNGRTHQQNPLVTYRGYQYVTYFDAQRRVCLGRRKLPDGKWDNIQFKDHKFKTNDSHNSAVIGICDKDGTIHMAFDHHATQLNYRISKIGAAHDPESVKWNAKLFSPVLHTLGTVKLDKRVTYPRFVPAPNGNLLLYYRSVTSGNGNGEIEEYDGKRHRWRRGMGPFIARDQGTYTFDGRTSQFRCPYMNNLSYAGDRLHASWIWRDRFEKTSAKNQHDLCYVYSDDNGRTWLNSDGKLIGRTGKKLINIDSPGLVVIPIPSGAGLSNQNTHYAYPDNSIHMVMRGRGKNEQTGKLAVQYFHCWRTSKGEWDFAPLPLNGKRPKLLGTKNHSLVLVYTRGSQLAIAVGKPNAKRTQWKWSDIKLPRPHSCYGDALIDMQRWEEEQILSVYSQLEPEKKIKTSQPGPVDGDPTPLYVVDYKITGL